MSTEGSKKGSMVGQREQAKPNALRGRQVGQGQQGSLAFPLLLQHRSGFLFLWPSGQMSR